MKYVVSRIFFVLFVALLVVSCGNNPFAPSASIFTDPSTPPYSTQEILITEGGVDSPYTTLGPIEYTLKSDLSIFAGQTDLRYQAIDYLKQNARNRYGDGVDAIIGIEFQESIEEGYFGSSITSVKGIAIAFKSGTKANAKPKTKHKAKSSKHNISKAKSANNTSRKTKPNSQEPEITPSEILK
ncbi:MAG: hypothetical protein ABL884_09465 [Methyloglobulus sp.]